MSMQGDRGSMESMGKHTMGVGEISNYLKGMNFPTNKQKIVDMAKSKGASENVVQWLNKLPDRQYTDSREVEQEFTKLK